MAAAYLESRISRSVFALGNRVSVTEFIENPTAEELASFPFQDGDFL